MIFNKYSEVKEGNQTVIGAYKGSSSNSSSSSSSNKSVGLDREIWGQDDDGGDLNGDLTCEGNMYIVDNWDNNEDDEDDDIDGYSGASRKAEPIMPLSIADDLVSKFNNEEGGNLYVKRQLVVDKDIFTPEIYGKSIFLDYPSLKSDNSNKTNLLDILKDHKKLTFNDTKGNNLGEFDNTADKTITIKNYEDEITNVRKAIPTNVSELNNDAGYITAEDIPDVPEIDSNAPVILFSGIIHSNNDDGGTFGNYQPWVVRPLMYAQHTGVDKLELNYLEIDGVKKCTLKVEVKAKSGWTIKPLSVNAINSLNVHCNPLADFGGNRRSQGFWMTGGVMPADGNIYLQVWRTEDANNDSTMNDQIAYSAQEINLTIFGTAKKV